MRKPSGIFATAVVAAALLFPLRSAAADQAAAPALTVSLVTPAERDWPETVPASGWLKPWQEAIIASETSGLRITEILADVGSVVKEPLEPFRFVMVNAIVKRRRDVIHRLECSGIRRDDS